MNESPRARHRFSIPSSAIRGGLVQFPPTLARQMRRVLRLRVGDAVVVFDGSGSEHLVTLTRLRDEEAVGSLRESVTRPSEPRLEVTLCQALLPREKFELVLQKGTELGISAFVPIVTERSLVKGDAIDESRLQRWRRILQEASEQCGRTRVPTLEAPNSLLEALADRAGQPILMAWERESRQSVRGALQEICRDQQASGIVLLVGPEGGFSEREANAAVAAGARTISLGARVMRAETAGPVLAALALYEAGDLEAP